MKGKSRVVMVKEPGIVELVEVPLPDIDPLDMLCKVEMSGVCGTDVHLVYDPNPDPKGLWLRGGISYPFAIGHEAVYRIVEMGSKAPKHDVNGTAIQEGDRIVSFGPRCGECYFCQVLDQPVLCRTQGIGRTARQTPRIGGTYADYAYVRGDAFIVRVPDGLTTKAAVLTEPLAGALRAVERSYLPGVPDHHQGMGPGKTVVVQGSGAVGILAAAVMKLAGAYKVIVIGAPENRLQLCRELGADVTINFTDTTAKEREDLIRDMTPHRVGPDIVIEAAGAPSAFIEAIDLVRNGGTVIEHGHFTYRGTIPIDPMPIVLKDILIIGNTGYYSSGFDTAIRVLESNVNRINFERAVTHEFPLAQAQDALEAARSQEALKAALVPDLG